VGQYTNTFHDSEEKGTYTLHFPSSVIRFSFGQQEQRKRDILQRFMRELMRVRAQEGA
jgi:hypothetical protein